MTAMTIERVRAPSTTDGTLTQPVSVQGKLMDRGEAAMFQG